jgi:ABC-type polysaccharide/polyol phosphate transport system ATPase subunit
MASVRLRDVSVEFPVHRGGSQSLKKYLFALSTKGAIAPEVLIQDSVRALTNVTLDLRDGDRIGLVGANGAGKTTLLKVLAGIYHPTGGNVYTVGRATALLDTALGFNPEATGRENIFLRGVYLKIRPREMRDHIEEIIEFSELGAAIDRPVRTYSEGMVMRLGIAISTCIPPEILIMDEWMSAGDAGFLEKARARVQRFVDRCKIVVLASHSLPLLREWCNHCVLLQDGEIAAFGETEQIIALYTGNTAYAPSSRSRRIRTIDADGYQPLPRAAGDRR